MKLLATLAADGYKLSHKNQYPEGTEKVYSTWIPRSGKHLPQVDEVVAFGFQGAIKEMHDLFDEQFFSRSKEDVMAEYKRAIKSYLFIQDADTSHWESLHDLGYLPLEIKALDEGTLVPFRVPILTIENTHNDFFWLTNYLETFFSALLWKPCTTASIARKYRQILDKYALETTGSTEGVGFQGHDFSARGMSGLEDAARSGMGHITAFDGSDTLPVLAYAEHYYNANLDEELVACSVPATEHSVMCAGGADDEYETYRRLIEDIHPTGIVSIVSDTWDLWHVMTDTLPKLKDKILARDGGEGSIDKVVIRPDSGNPADIICGIGKNPEAQFKNTPEEKGVIELLWDVFGGHVNEQGYKVLNPKIGAIYGDSITLEICEDICKRLKQKGFASTNVVFGIGSYTYQYLTRDSLGFAMKATNVTINGSERAIFKDPVTDDGTKKSLKGRCAVLRSPQNGKLNTIDDETLNVRVFLREEDLLTTVYSNGKLLKETSLKEIRSRLR
jgi:nicotinamide phosphoribosyltransferase